jgi:hypothetical protein
MTAGLIGRWLRVAGWAIPVLALCCCAPSAARAACGDYVVTRLSHDNATPADAHQQTDIPAPASPRKPCDGPNCQGRPVAPPVSAPTVVPPTPPEWGWLASAPACAPPGRGALLLDHTSSPPTQIASRVYHPPRCAA